MQEVSTALVLTEPWAPAPKELRDLLDYFDYRIGQVDGKPGLPRLPTDEERRALVDRGRTLELALRPACRSGADIDLAKDAIARMLGGYLKIFGDRAEILAGWTAELTETHPLWAIESVCREVRTHVGGLGLDPKSPPTIPQLHAFCRKLTDWRAAELQRLRKVLDVKLLLPPPAERPTAAKMRAMHGLPAQPSEADLAAADQRAKRTEEFWKKVQEAQDRKNLEEYAAHGEEPVYSSKGALIARSLARYIDKWKAEDA